MVHSNSGLVARTGLLILVLFVNLALVSTASAEPPPPRNILFIAIDDLRNWVHYGGDYEGIVHTPNIDALAAVSTRYLNAYATVPQCVGSRTSVLMGLSPATHHITFSSWAIEPEYHAVYSNPTLLSLPQVMTLSGYHTATTGKVFGTSLPDRWDEVGPDSQPVVCDFCPGPDNTFMTAEVLPDTEEHTDQTVTNWAVDFIENYDRSEPFFLAAGLYQPHVPWRVPQWAYDLYPIEDVVVSTPIANDLDDEPALAVQLATVQNPFTGLSQYEMIEYAGKAAEYTQAYLASISHTDAMVGQLLAAVAASPFASTTDIILWSDHGYHLGEKFHWRKNTLWDQSVKVPLLVSAPGNANYPVGDVFTPVSLLDVAPTVLDLTGITPFVQFEGVPLRDGASASPVEIYFNDGRALVMPRLGRKMIDYDLTTAQGSGDRASYRLTDIHEETNIYTNIGC
ncbi:MAG: sulfatase-like hydrolase/transferase [Halioglobus sp.]|nr:sulfatase-like hydrolase/transferase [Halioglobus sp.]